MEKNDYYSLSLPKSDKPRIVIVGGGFAGIEMAKELKNHNAQLVLLDRHNYHTFIPLLYQVATAGLEPDSIAEPLRKVIEDHKDFYFRLAKVNTIVPEKNLVLTDIGDLEYDYLILATGSKTNYFGNENMYKKAFPLKRITQALDLRSHMLQNFEKAVLSNDEEEIQKLMNIVIVGGGATGVEMAGAFGELKNDVLPKDYPELDFNKMNIFLVEGLPQLLTGMSAHASKKALKFLKEFGVKVNLNCKVKSFDGELVTFVDGSQIKTGTFIWAAGVQGNVIEGLRESSLERSRVLVDSYNRVLGYDNIFAMGDLASMKSEKYPNGHPMLAPVAVQQGKLLAKNLISILENKELVPFKYFDKGLMATIGRKKAVVDLPGGIKFSGFIAWVVWMFVHILYLVGFRNKLVVFSNWVWNYFTYDRGIRLIIRPFDLEKKTVEVD
ncbi:MAG: NAD(P)/FAD-dependent oxidoreductase [Bacteroidota bacterium]|nr:NAD(P)/FAD-dependent oxidoreductase [Bacteroidota bacterium]